MADAIKTMRKMKKADKLVRLAMRKNGPKSYKKGQGALLDVLLRKGVAERDELIKALGTDRRALKSVVKKAERNGYVKMIEVKDASYAVELTDEGKKIAQKRYDANINAIKNLMVGFSDEEIEQFDALLEKMIVGLKEQGICAKKRGRKIHGGKKHCRKH